MDSVCGDLTRIQCAYWDVGGLVVHPGHLSPSKAGIFVKIFPEICICPKLYRSCEPQYYTSSDRRRVKEASVRGTAELSRLVSPLQVCMAWRFVVARDFSGSCDIPPGSSSAGSAARAHRPRARDDCERAAAGRGLGVSMGVGGCRTWSVGLGRSCGVSGEASGRSGACRKTCLSKKVLSFYLLLR